MYERDFWENWWSTSVRFNYNIVDTDKYDIINGKAVERKDYKKKRLTGELESINTYIKHCENAIIEQEKRKKEIVEEMKEI
jgi:hypothetical protein